MSLNRKLLLIIVVSISLMWAALAVQLHYNVTGYFQSFDAQVRSTVRADMQRAIESQSMRLHSESQYFLALHGDPASAGLPDEPGLFPGDTLKQTDVISLFDATGKLLWSSGHDQGSWTAVDPDSLRRSMGELLLHNDTRRGQPGFINTAEGPSLVLSLALTSGAYEKLAGYLTLASRVNQDFVAALQESTGLATPASIDVLLPDDETLTPELARLFSSKPPEREWLITLEKANQATYTVIRDTEDNPILIFASHTENFADSLPINPGTQLMISLSALTMLLLIGLAAMLDRVLGRPLRHLKQLITAMDESGTVTHDLEQQDSLESISTVFERLSHQRHEHESRLRLFAGAVAAADDAIAINNHRGELIYANEGFYRLTGYHDHELKDNSRWWAQIIDHNTMELRTTRHDEWKGDIRIHCKDGEPREAEATVCKIDEAGDQHTHYVLIMHDITERNARTAEIQRLATAVEQLDDSIIITDTAARICYANPAYEKRCGMALEDMLGKLTNEFSHATSPRSVYEDLQETALQGKIWRGELTSITSDKCEVVNEAVVSPVKNSAGKVTNYVTILRDVTERVQMEQALREANNRIQDAKDDLENRVARRTEELRVAKEAAEAANLAKSSFLATVSHEIRTPLNGILGMIELLGDHPLDTEQRQLLTGTDISARLLLSLINDILDFSKIEAGQLVLEETAVSLQEVTESVVLALAPTAHRKNLRLQSTLSPQLPAVIKTDGIRLQQVLLNILGNAIKFTSSTGSRQGQVQLTVDCVDTRPGDEQLLRFRVRDNGIGISAPALEELFKPFTQAESSTTRRFGGTGLGLSICSRLIGLMGGEIQVKSEAGNGSEFTVLLPLLKASGEDTVRLPALHAGDTNITRPAANSGETHGHILVVEDNTINQDVVRLQLRTLGFSCSLASNGREAMSLWQQDHFDLILTDCQMPDMDGFELARAVRRNEKPGERVPIVALTANALRAEYERCMASGMDECLTKPVGRQRLNNVLTRHLSSAQQRAAVSPTQAHTTATAKTGILDMAAFADHVGENEAFMHELLQRFTIDSQNTVRECVAALKQRDAATLACNAHKLKTSARIIGAQKLAELCVAVEKAATDTDWQRLDTLIPQKQGLMAEVNQAINRELRSSPA